MTRHLTLKNRSDLAAVTLNSFDNSYRRITMTACTLYDGLSRKPIGELTSSNTQIYSLNKEFTNILTNDMINLTNELIIPNSTSGYIYKNADSYDKIVYALPPKVWTQDNNGKKVLISTKPIQDGDVFGTFRFKIDVFAEDF